MIEPMIPASHDEIVSRARRVVDEVIAKNATRFDTTGEFPADNILALGQAGLMGLFVPRRHGGLEASYRTFIEVSTLIGSACASTGMIFVMHHNQYIMIVEHGTEQQQQFFLPPVARGESLFASATTEPDTGGNANYCNSFLRETPQGLMLSARKPVVTAARHADWVLCTTRADENAPGDLLSMVAMPGIAKTSRVEPFGVWDCVGMRATSSSGLEYTDCEVPTWHRIGPRDSREMRATSMTLASRAGFSAVWLGIAEAAFQQTVGFLKGRRHQFTVAGKGPSGPSLGTVARSLAEYESVQRQVAEMKARLEAARHLLLAAGQRIDEARAEQTPIRTARRGPIQELLWSARLSCGEAAVDVTRMGLRLCGVTGMRKSVLSLERNMRDALTAQVMAPAEDVTKVVLGRQLLDVTATGGV